MIKLKIVYDDTCYNLVDWIVDTYEDDDIDIDCYDIQHYKEKKTAIAINVDAGTRKTPFIGAYQDLDGKEVLVGAMWGESTKIDKQNFKLFYEHIKELINEDI